MIFSSTLRIGWIREKVNAGRYQISEHVIRFLMAGLLSVPEIEAAIKSGEVIRIQNLPHRKESVLIHCRLKNKTVLVQASRGPGNWLVIPLTYMSTYPRWSELTCSHPDKGYPMENPFHQCFFCGGEVKAITVGNFDYRLNGKLYVIKNTPAGLCLQCGEKYVTAETAKKINALIERRRFASTEEVRVMAYTKEDQPAPPEAI